VLHEVRQRGCIQKQQVAVSAGLAIECFFWFVVGLIDFVFFYLLFSSHTCQ